MQLIILYRQYAASESEYIQELIKNKDNEIVMYPDKMIIESAMYARLYALLKPFFYACETNECSRAYYKISDKTLAALRRITTDKKIWELDRGQLD